jgi:hypothetical protein
MANLVVKEKVLARPLESEMRMGRYITHQMFHLFSSFWQCNYVQRLSAQCLVAQGSSRYMGGQLNIV